MIAALTIISLPAIASCAVLVAAALGVNTPDRLIAVSIGSAAAAIVCAQVLA